MRRGTIVILVFIVVVAAIIGLSQFLRTQPPVELRIAVSPLIADWIRPAIEEYNATNPLQNTHRVRFVVEIVEDTAVWLDDGAVRRTWTADNHPDAWIPAWSSSARYATDRMPFEIVSPSIARTPLVWGGFESRVTALTTSGDLFGWDAIAAAAAAGNWRGINPQANLSNNFTLAYSRPNQSVMGLAVLLSGAAARVGQVDLGVNDLNSTEFRAWMQPVLESVPNFNTLGASPAQTIAVRGSGVGEIALLPESEWLRNLRGSLVNASDPIVLQYPALPFVFDFPVAAWLHDPLIPSTLSPSDRRGAVAAFANWLLAPAQQSSLIELGLRPAQASVPETASLFVNGNAYGIQFEPDLSSSVDATSRNDIQRLLVWANSYIR